MERLDGASAGFGFSTILVIAKALPVAAPTPTTPYIWMRSAGTSSTAMMLALSSRPLAASIIWARQPCAFCTNTSGNSSAKGSWPTSSRAHQIAWPRPSGDCWRVKLKVPGSGKSCDNSARSAFLPRSTRVSSSSNCRSKWSSITALCRPVTKMKCSILAVLRIGDLLLRGLNLFLHLGAGFAEFVHGGLAQNSDSVLQRRALEIGNQTDDFIGDFGGNRGACLDDGCC